MESTPGLGGSADRSPGSPTRPRARSRRRNRRLRGGRLRRELAATEAALTAQSPGLAALYETFSLLHGDQQPTADPPAGAEPLPRPFWRRPRFAGAATLAVLAVIVALCATLSVELRPSSPGCLAAGSAPAAATTVAAAQVRAMDCGGYPASK
jgi:hypothetical protein